MTSALRPTLPAAMLPELREVLFAAAAIRDAQFQTDGVRRRIEQLRAQHTDHDAIELRRALEVLGTGPETASEWSLCRDLSAQAMNCAEAAHHAADLVWLAANTPYSVFERLEAMDALDQDVLWDQIAGYAQRMLRGEPSAWRRGELTLALATMSQSLHPRARAQCAALLELSDDPLLSHLLGDRARGLTLEAPLRAVPRHAGWTLWLGVTGLMWFSLLARGVQRALLGIERQGVLHVGAQALELRTVRRVRGEVQDERRLLLPRAALASIAIEPRGVRRLPLFGALALLVGSAFGAGAWQLGAAGGAPELFIWGLVCLAVGIGLDYALCELWPKRAGRVRLVVTPAQGRAFCLDGVEQASAERALELLRA